MASIVVDIAIGVVGDGAVAQIHRLRRYPTIGIVINMNSVLAVPTDGVAADGDGLRTNAGISGLILEIDATPAIAGDGIVGNSRCLRKITATSGFIV